MVIWWFKKKKEIHTILKKLFWILHSSLLPHILSPRVWQSAEKNLYKWISWHQSILLGGADEQKWWHLPHLWWKMCSIPDLVKLFSSSRNNSTLLSGATKMMFKLQEIHVHCLCFYLYLNWIYASLLEIFFFFFVEHEFNKVENFLSMVVCTIGYL